MPGGSIDQPRSATTASATDFRVDAPATIGEVYSKRARSGIRAKRVVAFSSWARSSFPSGYADACTIAVLKAVRETHPHADFAKAFRSSLMPIAMPIDTVARFKFGEKSDPLAMYAEDIFSVRRPILQVSPPISIPMGEVEQRWRTALPTGFQIITPHRGEEVLFQLGKTSSSSKVAIYLVVWVRYLLNGLHSVIFHSWFWHVVQAVGAGRSKRSVLRHPGTAPGALAADKSICFGACHGQADVVASLQAIADPPEYASFYQHWAELVAIAVVVSVLCAALIVYCATRIIEVRKHERMRFQAAAHPVAAHDISRTQLSDGTASSKKRIRTMSANGGSPFSRPISCSTNFWMCRGIAAKRWPTK